MERAGRRWCGPKTTREVASALQAAKPELGGMGAAVDAYASLKGLTAHGVVVWKKKAWGYRINDA